MRRRAKRYTWFPTNPTVYGEEPNGVNYYDSVGEVLANPSEGSPYNRAAVPLLQDQTIQPDDPDASISLRDRVEGQDYVVERVVGKVWADVAGQPADTGEIVTQRVLIAMGIAVLPVTDEDNTPALPDTDWDPLLSDNAAAPWMWRRTWVLYNNSASPIGYGLSRGPESIGQYGSMTDGGHVDVKSVRRVTKEQRLYICHSMVNLTKFSNGEGGELVDLIYHWGYDLRILGAMRKGRNRPTFK